jgi:hypothetical protein
LALVTKKVFLEIKIEKVEDLGGITPFISMEAANEKASSSLFDGPSFGRARCRFRNIWGG